MRLLTTLIVLLLTIGFANAQKVSINSIVEYDPVFDTLAPCSGCSKWRWDESALELKRYDADSLSWVTVAGYSISGSGVTTSQLADSTAAVRADFPSGGSSAQYLIDTVTVPTGGAVGAFVYQSTVDNVWRLADRDLDTTLAHAIIIENVSGTSYAIQTTGLATVTGHGYSVGANYSLSSTAGAATLSSSLTTGLDQWLFTVIDANTIDLKLGSLTVDIDAASSKADSTAFALTSLTADGTTTVDFQTRAGGYFQIDMGSTAADNLTFSNPATAVVPTYRFHWQNVTANTDTVTFPANVLSYAGDTLGSRLLPFDSFLECYYDGSNYWCSDTLGVAVTPYSEEAPFSPTDINSLLAWYSADIAYTDAGKTTLATTDGDLVYVWPDKSGNGYDMTQATSLSRPVYDQQWVSGNNQPALNFDGSSHNMAAVIATADTTDLTFFIVFAGDDPSQAPQGQYLFDNETDRFIISSLGPTTNVASGHSGYYDGAWRDIPFYPGTSAYISVWLFDDAGSDIIFNNTSRYTGTYTPVQLGTKNVIGYNFSQSSSKFDGTIAEIIIYERALTASEIDQVEAYLNTRYNIY